MEESTKLEDQIAYIHAVYTMMVCVKEENRYAKGMFWGYASMLLLSLNQPNDEARAAVLRNFYELIKPSDEQGNRRSSKMRRGRLEVIAYLCHMALDEYERNL